MMKKMIIKRDVTQEMLENVLVRYLKGKVRSGSRNDRLSPWDVRRIETFSPILTGEDWSMREELLGEIAVFIMENIHRLTKDESDYIQFEGESYYDLCHSLDAFVGGQANEQYIRKNVKVKREDGSEYRTTVYTVGKLSYDTDYESDGVLLELDSKALREYLLQDTEDYTNDFVELLYEYYGRYINGLEGIERVKANKRWDVFKRVVVDCDSPENTANDYNIYVSTVYRWIKVVKTAVVGYIKADRNEREKDRPCNIVTNARDNSYGTIKKTGVVIHSNNPLPVEIDYNLLAVNGSKTPGQSRVFTGVYTENSIPHFDFSVYDGWIVPEKRKIEGGEMANYKPRKRKVTCDYIPRTWVYNEQFEKTLESHKESISKGLDKLVKEAGGKQVVVSLKDIPVNNTNPEEVKKRMKALKEKLNRAKNA